MSLLNTNSISLFNNLTSINDGFRIPDEVYIHGKDFECFEQMGGSMYFSNYWYGDKSAAKIFAEQLGQYLKAEYEKLTVEEGDYDFHGMVMLWDLGDKALVGNISLNEDLAFWQHEKEIPEELVKYLKVSKLKTLLNDGNDNTVNDLLFAEVPKKVKMELFNVVSEDYKEEYIDNALEEGINIVKKTSKKSVSLK